MCSHSALEQGLQQGGEGAAGGPHSRAPSSPTKGPAWPPQYGEEPPPLSQGPKDELGGHADVHGTGWTPSLWTRARGQMPDANRFCHQDAEGLDADQLPLPRDRLREPTALSRIDERCQKIISPRRSAGPGRSSNPSSQAPWGRRGRQAARRAALPQPSCSRPWEPTVPSERKSRRGPLLGGAVGKQGALAPPGESGSYCLYPFYSPSTDPLRCLLIQTPKFCWGAP